MNNAVDVTTNVQTVRLFVDISFSFMEVIDH
jgi:hypothetical protein